MIIEVGSIVKSIARCRVRIEYFESKIPKKKEERERADGNPERQRLLEYARGVHCG